jgi:CubicO group peptidase (beta-lactamase class C family)
MYKYLFLFFITIAFYSCSESVEKKVYAVADVPPPPVAVDLYSPEVDSLLNALTQKEKIQQLFWLNVVMEEALKKEFLLPTVAFINIDATLSSKGKLKFDSASFQSKYFSTNYFQAFKELDKDLILQLEDLLTIGDTVFWKEYFATSKAFNANNNISCYIPNGEETLDSIFLPDWHTLEKRLLDSLYHDKILIGVQNDSVHSGHNHFFDNKNIGISIDLDSIPEPNDTVCKINLTTIDFTASPDEQFIEKVLLGNYDAVYLNVKSKKDLEWIKAFLEEMGNSKLINQELLDYKVRKCIALKLRSDKQVSEMPQVPVRLMGLLYQSKYKSITVVKNNQSVLPIAKYPNKNWRYINIGKNSCKDFRDGIEQYTEVNESKTSLKSFNLSDYSQSPTIVILNEQSLDSLSAMVFTKEVIAHHKKYKTIVINLGRPENISLLIDLPVLIQGWIGDNVHLSMLAQGVMGGNPINGKMLITIDSLSTSSSRKTRLSYTIPEEVGISKDSLKRMDKIAAEAVWGGVTPGCQVFASKDGKVFYDKAFGYHTYLQKQKVYRSTVYDIASVTKVASTTLCGMHMYDKGYYKIQDSLKLHLSDSIPKYLGHFSRLYNVNFFRLFTHTSGLPAGLPIYKMIDYRDSIIGRWDSYYCDEKNKDFKVEVAKNFYIDSAFLDSLWLETNNIWTGEKKYKYSDANMNVLYQIFRSKLNKSQRFEKYMDSVFYAPLDLTGTCFLPRTRIDTNRITPTENDTFWRKQLLKGYVHDPNAAIYGGVAGNAGLFSNASDLGIIMQMLMFGGEYGGQRYIQKSTVKKFSIHQEGSHRGLGFDKPTASSGNVVAPDCPYTAYGHTGFTGICVWNDPENNVVFTFVSNRVHPMVDNKKIISYGIRKRLHQVIYDQLYYNGTYKNKSTGDMPITKQKIKPV